MSELARLQARMDDVQKDVAETAALVRVLRDAFRGDDRSRIQLLEKELAELHKRNTELALKNQELTKLARFDPDKWSRLLAGTQALKKLILRYEHPDLFGRNVDFYASHVAYLVVLDLKPILELLDTD